MATAVGKTVLAVLDIQREVEVLRLENPDLVNPQATRRALSPLEMHLLADGIPGHGR
jgi:hypothetical protein